MESLGDTFIYGIFEHCTYDPIWIDANGNINLEIPSNMYIFAWGTNTRDTKISQKRGRYSSNTECDEPENRMT